MKNNLKISTIAIAATMLVTAPAMAVTLNLGGDGGLLSLGGSGSSQPTTAAVSVDTNLLGGGSNGTNVNVSTNLLDGAVGGDGTTSANVHLGSDGGSNKVLGIVGTGDDPTTANVNLGGKSGTNGDVLLNLFGPSTNSTPNARVTLGSGANGVADLGSGGNNADVILDLFGPSAGGGTTNRPNAATVNSAGPNGDDGPNGSGSRASASTGDTNGGGVRAVSGLRVNVASVGNTAGSCFAPDPGQINQLESRHDYGSAVSNWGGVSNLQVIDVGVCAGAGGSIGASPNIGRLQAFIGANATLKAGLNQAGHTTDDVIAADKKGKTLVVYVM